MSCKPYTVRNATLTDLDELVCLEKRWPIHNQASRDELKKRIQFFREGFFIAEDNGKIVASIIASPYHYSPNNLANYHSWQTVVDEIYSETQSYTQNALYIVSATVARAYQPSSFFKEGISLIESLAKQLKKQYVVAGTLLSGFGSYKKNNPSTSAHQYAFTTRYNRPIDPMIRQYYSLGFTIPNKDHVLENYYQEEKSANASTLVVKRVLF